MANLENQGSNQPIPTGSIPPLEELVQRTVTQFYSRKLSIEGTTPKVEAYYSQFHAVSDVVDFLIQQENVDPFNLASSLGRNSRISPAQIGFEFLDGLDDWAAVFQQIAKEVLINEINHLHPELLEESYQRDKKYPTHSNEG